MKLLTTPQKMMTLIYNNLRKLALLLILAVAFSCSKTERKTISCSTLIDVTGSNTASLKIIHSEDFMDVLDINANRDNAIEYRQAFITETFLNFTHKISLPPAPPMMMGNEFDRDEKLSEFKNNIHQALSLVAEQTEGRQYSSVYVPFAREVNRMARNPSHENLLILYSDLTENSDFMSFFNKNFQDELHQSPQVIEEYFQKELPLADNLSSLTIHIVHEPNETDNSIFKRLSRVYRSMLEKRGATVIVQANLMK